MAAEWSSKARKQFAEFCTPCNDDNDYFISLDDLNTTRSRIEYVADNNEAGRKVLYISTAKDYTLFQVTLNDGFIEEVKCQSTNSVRVGPGAAGWPTSET